MRPDTTRRLSGPERLEDRQMMDATASNILWEPAALSADNESAILANATARSLAMDVALPDASRLARGLLNGDVEIYDTYTGARMHTIPSNGSYVSQIETSPDGKTLAVGTGAPNVRLFDANSYAEIGGFAMPGFVYSIVFRGDEIFASTSDGGATTVYDMRTRAVRTILGGANQANYITSIGDRLYGYDARGVLKEVDPASGQVLRSVNIPGGSRIDASSESGIIAMGTAEGNIVVFDENLNQLGAFHPGMGAIQHVGFDASGTRLTARSDAAGIVFIDLSNIRAGGMMTEAGRAPAGDSAAYEVGMPMTPDGTVAFVHEANSVTALKTPWEPLPPPLSESGSEPGEIGIPSEVTDLIEEAVRLARNGTPWRAPEAGEIVSTSSAKATRVQLTPQTGEAVAFMANVFPTTSVTAHAYKGTEKIWSGAVPSDGVFSYENAEGITDVLFTSGSTTYVSNVSIVTDEAVDVPAYALTPMNSAEFATFAARPITQPTNMAAAAQRLDIRGAMSGTGSSESRVLLNRDQSNYTLLRMNVSSGNSRIFDVKAIRLKGLDYRQREEVEFVGLQDGFLERIDDRTWIVAPGMPATLVATLGFYQKSTYSIQVVNGLSREAIMPLLTMGKNTVDIDLLTMNDQFRTEGVFPGMTDVRQSEWPVFAKAGHRLNATYNIQNEALNGGAVGLDVYVGWYTGEPTRGTLQETFSFPLGGGETKMISVNVTAPPKPADATSDRPIIHTVARLPNGESAIHARLGKAQKGETRVITNREGGGLNISYVSREYTAAEYDRIRRATDKALMALLNSPDERLTAVRNALGNDRIVELLAESSAAALAAASSTTDEEAIDVAIAAINEDLSNQIDPAYLAANGEFVYDPYRGSVPTESFISSISSHLPRKHVNVGESEVHPALLLNVNKLQPASIPFDITEKKMVNFSVEASEVALAATNINSMPAIVPPNMKGNVRMVLTGTTAEGYPVSWSTERGAGSGESMSGMLSPGSYRLEIFDETDYLSAFNMSEQTTIGLKALPLNFSIVPHNSANIEGRISVEGSPKVMPVSMRVAEFISDGNGGLKRNENYQSVSKLKSDLPVWVVIHGRTDSERGELINDLARSLYQYANGNFQIITVNWEDAAKDLTTIPLFNKLDLEDAKWTPAVGKWTAQQLLANGFSPSQIHVGAHSHGTFAGFFTGQHIFNVTGQKIGSFVALDSAKNPAFIGADILEETIIFRNVSEESISLHSSWLGSENRAHGAERAIGISSPDTISPLLEHGYAISTFADALDDLRTGQNTLIASTFHIDTNGMISTASIIDSNGYDIWISVRSAVSEDGTRRKSQASALWKKKIDGAWGEAIFDPIFVSSIPVISTPASSEGALIY